jgi:hypothetical protein
MEVQDAEPVIGDHRRRDSHLPGAQAVQDAEPELKDAQAIVDSETHEGAAPTSEQHRSYGTAPFQQAGTHQDAPLNGESRGPVIEPHVAAEDIGLS